MKVSNPPRVKANRDMVDVLREMATTINLMIDYLSPGEALGNYADDTAAAAGGVQLYEFYRNGSVVMQRIA